jgi:hypothetical protein
MIDLADRFDDLADVESLVRAAGEVVYASDDLRPRVLEQARLQMHERRARRWVRRMAMAVVAAATLSASSADPREGYRLPVAAALAYPAGYTDGGMAPAPGVNADWGMVDGFTEMRRLQAEVLRTAM